jgi:protein-S-isoprenylcysteine O-methyltransferase Ste14
LRPSSKRLDGVMIEMFGDEYRRYRQRVSMLIPWRKVV